MSVLAERSGVPSSTIKHYIREGLLPDTAVRTSRNMAWYDEGLVETIKLIRDLQRDRYLPLRVIKQVLADPADRRKSAAKGLARGLAARDSGTGQRLSELIAEGLAEADVAGLSEAGLLQLTAEDNPAVIGDDLLLLKTLIKARRAGFDAARLPVSSLVAYKDAVAQLVRFEWQILAASVLADPDSDAQAMSEAGVDLGEVLIMLLRRKQLLPIMHEMSEKTS